MHCRWTPCGLWHVGHWGICHLLFVFVWLLNSCEIARHWPVSEDGATRWRDADVSWHWCVTDVVYSKYRSRLRIRAWPSDARCTSHAHAKTHIQVCSTVTVVNLRVATHLENLEKSGSLRVVRENRKSQGKCVLACGLLPRILFWTQNIIALVQPNRNSELFHWVYWRTQLS